MVAGSESLKRDSWSVDQRRASHLLRGKAAESVAVLLVVEVPAATVLEVSLEVSRGWDMRDPRKLFYRLAAVPSLHDAMLTGLEQTAVSERSDRAGAEERSQRLALYAHLIGAISEGDAQEVFRSAIAVASELDMEMQDQLLFIRHMVERSREEIGPGRRKVAIALGEVIHDAAVRLPEKHFPWHAAVGALARLDLPVALAAAARWEDARVVRLQHTLGHITLTGLEGNELSVAQATALLSLAPDLSGDPWSEVVAHAEKTSGGSTLADELARDMLLHREQHGASVEEFVARAGVGHWSDRFRSYRVFKANSGLNALAQGRFRRDEETHQAVAASPPMGWPPASLIEAESLGIEAQRRTEESRENGHYVSISDHFEHAAAQVSRIHRVAHLEALRVLDLEWEDDDVLWALLGRIHDWKSHGAVRTWAERHAADLVSLRLPALCRQVRRRTNELGSLWEMAGAAGVPVHEVLLQGLERNLDHFDVASALTVATLLCEQIDGSDIAAVCAWYVARLDQRIGPSFREEVPASAVPDSVEVAIARTMFACLSDVDVRVRWRCAHALRRLARMQDQDTVDAVVAEYTRREEHAFRATRAPLYWVSARLWLTIALDRMALESPAIVSRHGIHLIAVACDESFPHILISDFARDAAMKLIDSGHLKTDVEVTAGLERVNRSPLPRDTKSRPYGETFDSLQPLDGNLRFRFDAIDTLRYWYDPMLRAFSSVSPSEFLRVAEHWIVDEWCASPDGDGHVAEPREALFDQRMWRLSSHSHGSRPTVEKLQAYLEWNAMWCAAGDLLKTAPLAALQYGEDDFHYQLKSGKVTVPPIWLADLATPPPLQDSRWRTPTAPVADWVEATSDDELLAEVLPEDTADYVVVHAHIDDASRSYRQTTRVSSALVSPATAHALVRSLQTTHDSSNFYICPEGDECEIDEVGFKLTGWLASHDGDSRLDDKDVFANGIHRLEFAPGVAVSKTLGLMPRYDHGARWYREGEHRPTFIYEAWGKQGDESDHDAHYGNTTESSGHRLLVRKSDLAEFLRKKKRDLIVESEITRRVPEKDGHTHDPEKPKRVEFERILLFRRDGLVQGAERDFGSWRSLGT